MEVQPANAPVERPIDEQWWYFLSLYTLAQKRQILFAYVIGVITGALGKLIPNKKLPSRINIGVFGLTSSGKSATINTCLQHQAGGANRQIVAAEGDGVSGVTTTRLGFYPIIQGRAQFVDIRGLSQGSANKEQLKELTKIGMGLLTDIQRDIRRENDIAAVYTLIDSSALRYAHIHVPLVCLAANATNEQQASVVAIVEALKKMSFGHIVLVITKAALDAERARGFQQKGFAGIPPKDVYLLDNYPSAEVENDPVQNEVFMREQANRALDIMLACIVKAECNGLYNVIDVNYWVLIVEYVKKCVNFFKNHADDKISIGSIFLQIFGVIFVLYILIKSLL